MTIKPEEPKQPGKLIICSTPIGNLKDISLRVIEALGQVDAVLAEDTRVTCKLLNHLKINPPLERCDENVIRSRLDSLVERILDGENLAYVSDAGTPSVSDPGAVLVSAVRDKGLTVEVLPGASAVLTALVASGFTAPGFYFGGFLPRKAEKQAKLFEQLASLPAVLVFFESPHRVMATLKAIELAYPNRRVCLARELTKLYEEVLIDTAHGLSKILEKRQTAGRPWKGETVILIGMPTKSPARKHVDKYQDLTSPGLQSDNSYNKKPQKEE